MWVSQTYLGAVPDGEASLFVYFLFQDYKHEQKRFLDLVHLELERLGDIHGSKVSLLMPNPRYADRIEAQVLKSLERVDWSDLDRRTPSLLLTRKPLTTLTRSDEAALIEFTGKRPQDVARIINDLSALIDKALLFEESSRPEEAKKLVLPDWVKIEPGWGPFKVDLRKLFRV